MLLEAVPAEAESAERSRGLLESSAEAQSEVARQIEDLLNEIEKRQGQGC